MSQSKPRPPSFLHPSDVTHDAPKVTPGRHHDANANTTKNTGDDDNSSDSNSGAGRRLQIVVPTSPLFNKETDRPLGSEDFHLCDANAPLTPQRHLSTPLLMQRTSHDTALPSPKKATNSFMAQPEQSSSPKDTARTAKQSSAGEKDKDSGMGGPPCGSSASTNEGEGVAQKATGGGGGESGGFIAALEEMERLEEAEAEEAALQQQQQQQRQERQRMEPDLAAATAMAEAERHHQRTAISAPETPHLPGTAAASAPGTASADVALTPPSTPLVRAGYDLFVGPRLTGDGTDDAVTCKYRTLHEVSSGRYGSTRVVERTGTKQRFVAKTIKDIASSSATRDRLKSEIHCMQVCNGHPHVVGYVESEIEGDKQATLIVELCDGGDIKFQHRQNVVFGEQHSGILLFQLILALHHMHERRVIHRDIKTANLMLTTDGILKVGDFGFSRQYVKHVSNNVAATPLGTPFYQAPEICELKRYSAAVDIWAAGVVLYELLTRRMPFDGKDKVQLYLNIRSGEYIEPEDTSPSMLRLLREMLTVDPTRRPNALQILRRPIMRQYCSLFVQSVLNDRSVVQQRKDIRKKGLAVVYRIQKLIADADRAEFGPLYGKGGGGLATFHHTESTSESDNADDDIEKLQGSFTPATAPVYLHIGSLWKSRVLSVETNGRLSIYLPPPATSCALQIEKLFSLVTDVTEIVAEPQPRPALRVGETSTASEVHVIVITLKPQQQQQQQQQGNGEATDSKQCEAAPSTLVLGMPSKAAQQFWYDALTKKR